MNHDPPAHADAPRVGYGTDLHRLAPGEGARIGGIWIEAPFRIEAHSDGDVLLHALTDALLGALAAGDIGDLFPDTDPALRAADSSVFVRAAMEKVYGRGLRVGNIDAVLHLERPRLGGAKRRMAGHIAALCGCPPDAVSVKAKSGEGLGALGAGEAVAAAVVALLLPVGGPGGPERNAPRGAEEAR